MAFHEVQWYDRNPSSEGDRYDANKAPHISTLRLKYIVPKDRQAMLELIQIVVTRTVAAAPVGEVTAYMILNTRRILTVRLFTNVVGDENKAELGGTIVLNYGDEISFWTTDSSTGGEVRYFMSYKVTEFDAYIYEYPPKTLPTPIEPPPGHVQEPGPQPDPVM